VSSEKQIDANRRNGEQSQGPQSDAGKAASSRNSLKHGLLSRDVLLPDEDPAAFAESGERLTTELNPQSELESVLVDRIVALFWRLQRLGKIEAGILTWQHFCALSEREGNKEHLATMPDMGDPFEPEKRKEYRLARSERQRLDAQKESDAAKSGAAFIYDSGHENALAKLSRYETSMERSLYKALHELQRLQAARQGKEVPVPVAIDVDVSGVEPQDR
jgi:hypothetical protein